MKPRARWSIGLIVAAATALTAYSISTAVEQKRTLSKVHAMTTQMKTVCVGRLSLDVPGDANIEFGAATIAGVNIDATNGTAETELAKSVKELQDQLAGKTNEYDRPSLEKMVEAAALDFKATVLYYGRAKPLSWLEAGKPVTSDGDGINVEAFGWKDEVLYHFKAVDLASPTFEKNVEQLIARFEPRAANTVPAQPGFCVDRGLVHDPIPATDHETATVFVAPKGLPDVAIRMDTAVQDKIATSLLERDAKDPTRVAHPDAITTMRKGIRTINGIPGEEVLIRVKNENGTTSHFAMWASKNKPGDVMAPAITLEIETGKGKGSGRVNSSLSDEALLQLWDKVSATLRFRATPAVSAAVSVPTKQPLGEMAATGSHCPQSGFWECSDHGNVVGGRRRFFHTGEQLPPAAVATTRSIWQKLSGDIPTHRVDTVWTLVAYALDAGAPDTGDAAAHLDNGSLPTRDAPGQDGSPKQPGSDVA